MSTWRELVYMCLDLIKAFDKNASVVEEHVVYLAKNYRIYLLEQEKLKNKLFELSESNYLEICFDTEVVDAIPGMNCSGLYLRSTQKIPLLIDNSLANIYPTDYFDSNIQIVDKNRFKFVGYNNYQRNIIYATIGVDDYVYFKSANPQYLYLKKARLSGIFEDSEEAAKLSCEDNNSEDGECIDFLDKEFPLEAKFIPLMIELLVKLLLNFYMRPKDNVNDSADNMADLVAYVRRNMKSDLAKQLTM